MKPADVPASGAFAAAEKPEVVLHLVGRLTDAVFNFLGPATDTLAASGSMQVLVLIGDEESRALVLRLHRSVEVLFAEDHANPLRRWLELRGLLRSVLRRKRVTAMHLHGLLPGIVGSMAARRAPGERTPVYFSPHSSRTLVGPWRPLAAPLVNLLGPLSGLTRQVAIANVGGDARRLAELTGEEIGVIDSPVDDAFFQVARHESRRPLLLASGNVDSAGGVEIFSQLAILLAGSGLGCSFNWMGKLEASAQKRLTAANVGVYDPISDADRAARMIGAWIYVSADEVRGFPARLAEAMAMGLPCVVLAASSGSDLVEDGVSGFLCQDQRAMLQRVAELIDSASLRIRLGEAARARAAQRFSSNAFSRNLLAAYRRGGPTPSGPDAPILSA